MVQDLTSEGDDWSAERKIVFPLRDAKPHLYVQRIPPEDSALSQLLSVLLFTDHFATLSFNAVLSLSLRFVL